MFSHDVEMNNTGILHLNHYDTEADIMAERNSGDRVATGDPVDRAYMKRQKMTYAEYKYSRTVQHLSCYMLH